MLKFRWIVPVLLMISVLILVGCNGTPPTETAPSAAQDTGDSGSTDDSSEELPRIFWVDSYHAELDTTAEVEAGIHRVLDDANVEFQKIHMDTRNNREEEFCMQMGEQVLEEIETFQPDVLIVTEDNAQRCLVVPHLMDSELPIVFGGVNWDASVYGYPTDHITGIVEVDLIENMMEHLEGYAEGGRVAYLSVDGATDRKTAGIYNERFFAGEMETFFVNTYEEFQAAYLQIQEEADIMLLGNYSGIEGWDDEVALAFIIENARIPSGARTAGQSQFVLLSVFKRLDEQGETTAEMALQILDGTPPSDIPVVENQLGVLALHLDLAEQLNITFSPSMLRNASVIYGEDE